MFSKDDGLSTWQDLFSISPRWKLSKKEKQLLGEDGQREYYKKVDEYCLIEASGACSCFLMMIPVSIFIDLIVGTLLIDILKPTTSEGLLGLIAASCAIMVMASVALSISVGRLLKTKDTENPKAWKNMILNQNTSQKDNSLEINHAK